MKLHHSKISAAKEVRYRRAEGGRAKKPFIVTARQGLMLFHGQNEQEGPPGQSTTSGHYICSVSFGLVIGQKSTFLLLKMSYKTET